MAPRPTAAASRSAAARGCHVVQHQMAGTVPASAAPVWISDTVLAHAFARFSRVSHAGRTTTTTTTTQVRLSSSVPGPLEARRRLGKRQMTEQLGVTAGPHHPLPPLPYPFLGSAEASDSSSSSGGGGGWCTPAYSLDPRLWQWVPPRGPAQKQQHTQTEPRTQIPTPTQTRTSALPWLGRIGDVLGELTPSHTTKPEEGLPPPPPPPSPPTPPRRPPPPQAQQTPPPPLPRSAAAQDFFDDLEAWQRSSSSSSSSLSAICRSLETQLRLAALTADEADEALRILCKGLPPALAPTLFTAVLRGVRACRLLPADAAAADLGPAFWRRLLEAVLCTVVVVGAGDTGRRSGSSLAADVLAATPPALLARDLSDLLPAVLETVFGDTAAGVVDDTQAAAVAAALRDVVVHEAETDTNGDVVATTTRQLLQRWTAKKQQQHQREQPPPPQQGNEATLPPAGLSAWLRTLAHMPQVCQERLFAVLAQAQACAPSGVSDLFLCDLLLAQWGSRGYAPADQIHKAYEQALHGPPTALAAFALAVYETPACRPSCVGYYVSLLKCLRRLGRGEQALVASVEALMEALVRRQSAATTATATASSSPLPLPFLEHVAWATDDLPSALRLHTLYAQHAQHARRQARAREEEDPTQQFLRAMADCGDGGDGSPTIQQQHQRDGWPLWRLAFWNKFADRLSAELDRGALTPGQVSFALDLVERSPRFRVPRGDNNNNNNNNKLKKEKPLGAPTVALLERLATRYALAPELEPRRALRGVWRCRAVLQQYESADRDEPGLNGSTGSTGSSTLLRAIFHLVTRDLADAQPGRTSRLRWYLDMVQREHSPEAALVSARALERWRTMVKRVDHAQRKARW